MTDVFFFFFNDTATTEIYTLSLHDALPISTTLQVPLREWEHSRSHVPVSEAPQREPLRQAVESAAHSRLAFAPLPLDRKSTRLNSSHANISYAVFCLKKTT